MPDGGALPVSGNTVIVSPATVMPNGQKFIALQIVATAANPVAKGPWSFSFQETAGQPATIDIWVEREDNDVFPMFTKTDAVRDYSITIPGTCLSVITVASYDPDRFLGLGDLDLSDFSSWGLPIAAVPAGRRVKPDIAAPGQKIMAAASGTARHGPPCCACCNYLHVDMQGTSMASPHVAGAVALLFEKNPELTCEQARAFIQLGASRDSIPSGQMPVVLPLDHGGGAIGNPGQPGYKEIFWNNMWGSGRLDARASVDAVVIPPGGGGGGGGGGNPAPAFIEREDAVARTVPEHRLLGLPAGLTEHPAFQLVAALVSTHVDEVRRLIDQNKRVAVVWRRGGGPTILRHLLERPRGAVPLLPAEVESFPLKDLLDRLMKVLSRFGSETLRLDVERWGELVLAAPGSDIDALDAHLREIAP
jgi:hypothetical protein